jgi:hypothetical protein
MTGPKVFALAAAAALALVAGSPKSEAQIGVGIGVNVGAPPPACPYGYYDYPPYQCAPYGYYGPEWFANGIFIGAGPWFHGPVGFHGYVDNHYDLHHGYRGPLPGRGERYDPGVHGRAMAHFHGNEWHDGHGHIGH